jgi:uncharacterized protein YdbL (DUF1318 family)
MTRRTKNILTAAVALAVLAGGAGAAYALVQGDAAASLRSTGQVGEQADGYLGVVGSVSGSVRAQVDSINIQRRAYYTGLAQRRGAKIEEVAATTACELFRTKIEPGQFYRGTDGVWKKRAPGEAVPLPSYCG